MCLSPLRKWIVICQWRLNENGFNPSEVNGINSISCKINESLFAFGYKRLPRTVNNSWGCIDVTKKMQIYLIFFKKGKTKQKILQINGAGAADGFIRFINYSCTFGSCKQMGIQVCQVSKKDLCNYYLKTPGLWVYVAHISTPKIKKETPSKHQSGDHFFPSWTLIMPVFSCTMKPLKYRSTAPHQMLANLKYI